jgi:hypothetical protein
MPQKHTQSLLLGYSNNFINILNVISTYLPLSIIMAAPNVSLLYIHILCASLLHLTEIFKRSPSLTFHMIYFWTNIISISVTFSNSMTDRRETIFLNTAVTCL